MPNLSIRHTSNACLVLTFLVKLVLAEEWGFPDYLT